jgi:hypothetical protein
MKVCIASSVTWMCISGSARWPTCRCQTLSTTSEGHGYWHSGCDDRLFSHSDVHFHCCGLTSIRSD